MNGLDELLLAASKVQKSLNQVRSELKPLLELKGDPEALEKLARMTATVERRLRTKR